MKLHHPILSIVWFALGVGLVITFVEHGKLIGGMQYFVHMGIGGAAAAEVILIAGAFIQIFALLFNLTVVVKLAAVVIGAVALAFGGAFFLPIKPLHLLSPMLFPFFGGLGPCIPFIAAFLAAYTWYAFAPDGGPDSEA